MSEHRNKMQNTPWIKQCNSVHPIASQREREREREIERERERERDRERERQRERERERQRDRERAICVATSQPINHQTAARILVTCIDQHANFSHHRKMRSYKVAVRCSDDDARYELWGRKGTGGRHHGENMAKNIEHGKE